MKLVNRLNSKSANTLWRANSGSAAAVGAADGLGFSVAVEVVCGIGATCVGVGVGWTVGADPQAGASMRTDAAITATNIGFKLRAVIDRYFTRTTCQPRI